MTKRLPSSRLLLALSALLFLCHSLTAQSLLHFGLDDGLSNSAVTAVASDCRGCIWIGTESGLNRYDGSRFTAYRRVSTPDGEIPIYGINCLYFDPSDSILWIGTRVKGVMALDCRTMQFATYHVQKDGYPFGNIMAIAPGAEGGLWFSPNNGLPTQCRLADGCLVPIKTIQVEMNHKGNRSILDDGNGMLYIGQKFNGLTVIDQKSGTARHYAHRPDDPNSLPSNNVGPIFKDSKGNLWIGTSHGLSLYNPSDQSFLNFYHDEHNPTSLAGDNIAAIVEDSKQWLWIGTEYGGISRLDLSALTFASADRVAFSNMSSDHLPGTLYSDNAHALHIDDYGNIWVGNHGNGVDVIPHINPPFTSLKYSYPASNRPKEAWGLWCDNNDNLWVGSENELALFVGNQLAKTYDLSPYLTHRVSRAQGIVGTPDNRLLLAMAEEGLLVFDPKTGTAHRVEIPEPIATITALYPYNDTKLMIGSTSGLFSYTNGSINDESKLNSMLPAPIVTGIVRDRAQRLWVGTYGGGVIVFDDNGDCALTLRVMDGLTSDGVSGVYADSQGGMWVLTRAGLDHIPDIQNPKEIKSYRLADGLDEEYIRSIAESPEGHIWITTSSAVYSIIEDTLMPFFLPSDQGLGNFVDNAAAVAATGELYFGSINGVLRINPKPEGFEAIYPKVRFIEGKVIGEENAPQSTFDLGSPAKKSMVLKADENSFELYYGVEDCALSNMVEYQYFIKGKTEDWVNLGDQTSLTFRHLSPGTYNIELRARLINQPWEDSEIALAQVTVQPPLYDTWWAHLAYGLIAVAAAVGIALFYRRKLRLENALRIERQQRANQQEMHDERLRFFTNITHELRTPLTLITGPLEDLLGDPSLHTPALQKIKLIHSNANQLLGLINQIMEFRKTETHHRQLSVGKGNVAALTTEIGLHFKELNSNDHVEIVLSIDNDIPDFYFDDEIVRTVLNNLLGNALKYTQQGQITLSARQVEKDGKLLAEISVSDTGYGIDPKALPHIFERYYQASGPHQASGTGIGLSLVKSLLDLHQSTITAQSQVGRGSTFTFWLSITNTYPEAIHKSLATQLATSPTEAQAQEPDEAKERKQPMILVVEDNADIRRYIMDSFIAQYDIITATNGQEGWMQATTHLPDLIVSDIMMPVMDGNELCQKLKNDIRTSHIPVVLLTAKDSLRDKEEGYGSGADSYITKPFSAKLLGNCLHSLLEGRRKLAAWIGSQAAQPIVKPAEAPTEALPNPIDQKFLDTLSALIQNNIESEDLDVNLLVEGMNMSHSTLYRKIKSLTGMNVNELIRKRRLQHSVQLMREGYNVTEAAYGSGFNTLDYFRACFKNEYGMSPSQYMRQQEQRQPVEQ
ncbi:MAG: response regulator [Bacteroidales bacterium]|nr:response regulator [Bacteroidales bacterium]